MNVPSSISISTSTIFPKLAWIKKQICNDVIAQIFPCTANRDPSFFCSHIPDGNHGGKWLALHWVIEDQAVEWHSLNGNYVFLFLLSWHATSTCFIILIKPLTSSVFFIHHLTVRIILTQWWKVKDQFDTVERLRTILTQIP